MGHERFLDEGRDYGALADTLYIDHENINLSGKEVVAHHLQLARFEHLFACPR
jgi:hypothetical protein